MKKESELAVITRAKELCQYIMVVTDKSPKKFRFTLVSRLQNYSLSVIENLYRANDIYLVEGNADPNRRRRIMFQREAMIALRMIGYFAVMAREQQCILPRQQSQIAKLLVETQRILYAWVKSDEKRN